MRNAFILCCVVLMGCSSKTSSGSGSSSGTSAATASTSTSGGSSSSGSTGSAGTTGSGSSSSGSGGSSSSGSSGGAPDAGQGMVAIPAGTFMMGCNSAVDTQCLTDESPYHQVSVSAFALDITEITEGAFSACVDAGACAPPSQGYDPVNLGDHPVNFVTWQQCTAYCAWLGKRLPTEAEWEWAARGTDGRVYPWGSAPAPDCTLANFTPSAGACVGNTAVVGSHAAGDGPFGTHDTAGNLWEYTADWYAPDYYANSPTTNPRGPDAGWIDPNDPTSWPRHTKRGGSWVDPPDRIRTSRRWNHPNDGAAADIGCRCAR